jgi:hypothetical protein
VDQGEPGIGIDVAVEPIDAVEDGREGEDLAPRLQVRGVDGGLRG